MDLRHWEASRSSDDYLVSSRSFPSFYNVIYYKWFIYNYPELH